MQTECVQLNSCQSTAHVQTRATEDCFCFKFLGLGKNNQSADIVTVVLLSRKVIVGLASRCIYLKENYLLIASSQRQSRDVE